MEKQIKICFNKIELIGLFHHISNEKTAVITHPHPLYGGNMYNPVVKILQEELIKNGYSTLRFNFRQCNEPLTDKDSIKDLETIFDYLKAKGFSTNFLLAGYSYGSWINSTAVSQGLNVSDSIMVSPPVAFLDYKDIQSLSCPGLVITGDKDDIAPPEHVKKSIMEKNAEFKIKIIKGCDHFYGGYAKELKKLISEYLKN